jgi:serine-type D-Ala-D-Ala carboxypeptidase/endopeptidase (penicillin-binding protein 4)
MPHLRLLPSILLSCFACLTFVGKPARGEDSGAARGAQRVKQEIESILPESKKGLKVGILAVSLTKGDIIYQRNADKALIPASVSKLFTAFATLKKLGPTATFKTHVYRTGSLADGKLTGDLYLKGGGDPSLVSERMWMLVNELVRSGIKSITGNLIADSTYYDEERTPDTRPTYLQDQAYNAPVGALSFNFNTTTIFVRPNDDVGKSPIVYTDPENSYIDVVNQATTGKSEGENTITVKRTSFVKGDIGDTVLLRGSIPQNSKEVRFYRNIVNPSLYTAHMFRTFWEKRGLELKGNVTEGKVPASAKLVLEFDSLPIWQIVWGMNKFSNNFVADQLMKKLGAEVWGPPGTLAKGLTALGDVLEDIGIPRKSYTIIDGSGLTRKTTVTPRQIVQVLTAAQKDHGMGAEFAASLGIGGEDGTLRNRLPSSKTKGSTVRGKTGSLDGVTALAGYLDTEGGEMVAFAAVLNDPRLKYGRMTGWVDSVAVALAKFSRK